MSEIVERVAIAIRRKKFERTRRSRVFDPTNITDDEVGEARAAIEAMGVPTQAMRLAGVAEYARNDVPASEGPTIVFDRIYNAMIAEALK